MLALRPVDLAGVALVGKVSDRNVSNHSNLKILTSK